MNTLQTRKQALELAKTQRSHYLFLNPFYNVSVSRLAFFNLARTSTKQTRFKYTFKTWSQSFRTNGPMFVQSKLKITCPKQWTKLETLGISNKYFKAC